MTGKLMYYIVCVLFIVFAIVLMDSAWQINQDGPHGLYQGAVGMSITGLIIRAFLGVKDDDKLQDTIIDKIKDVVTKKKD